MTRRTTRRTARRWAAGFGLAGLLAGGCAHGHRDPAKPAAASDTPLPMMLQGANTRFRLQMTPDADRVQTGEFQQDEICYLDVGPFRIDCFTDGSSLNLGPNDSTTLLSDNPMWGLEPPAADKLAVQYTRLYGILFLVGGSIDRLPQALSDYLQDPGQHGIEATALTRLLLARKSVEFEGHARGGNFRVQVQLTDDGRDKLLDALDEAGEPPGPTQLVRHHTPRRVRKR